jgi:predicted kinase
MSTLYMMKGLPASGKSTRAKQMQIKLGNTKVVNRDQLRAMLDDSRWSRGNEFFTLTIRDAIIREALREGKNVIVDDTNLAPRHETDLRALAKECSATFEIVDMTDVTVDECIARDGDRTKYVGAKVIIDMWWKYLRPTPTPPPVMEDKPWTVICDIDGTVANMNGRDPFDETKVGDDLPRTHIIDMVNTYCTAKGTHHLIFMSGRSTACKNTTHDWIIKHFNRYTFTLLMRTAGDSRRDSIVKRELYDKYIRDYYNVAAIFDDRPQVIRECWYALGFEDRLFNVGNGREF